MYKLLLCFRYLTTRYIGLVSIASVMLGVATMIIVNSVMLGFREKMRDRLHGILADVIVESPDMNGFSDPGGIMELIQDAAGDKIVAMTPAVEVFAILQFQYQGRGPHRPRPIRLLGIEPAGRAAVGEFTNHLVNPDNQSAPSFAPRADAVEWRMANPELIDVDSPTPRGAIIGYQIATFRERGAGHDQPVIQPGQEVIVTTVTAGRPKPVDARFTVVDLFKCEMSEYDSNYVFVPLAELQRLRGMGDSATSIQIKLKNFNDAPAVVAAIKQVLPPYFEVNTWEDKQGPLLHAVKVEAALLNIILFFIITVAGFGILAIFFMIVFEKTRDIGILKALGASNGGVMGIFLSYGLALGLVGCGLGAVAGILLTWNINPIEQTLSRWTGLEIFPRDIYYFKNIPARLDWFTVIWVNAGALLIAVGAAVLPARRAAKLQPLEALRYE